MQSTAVWFERPRYQRGRIFGRKCLLKFTGFIHNLKTKK